MHRTATVALAAILTLTLFTETSHAKVDKAMLQRAMATLEFGAKSGDFTTRAMALEGLGHGVKKKALPLVKEGTEDPQWQVRRAAISALLTMKDSAWKGALVTAMQSENLQAESEVLPLMQPLGVKKAVSLMQGALNDKEFPKPERYADALKAVGGDLMVAAYKMGLKLRNKDAQAAFASNLAGLPIPDALPLYKAILAKQVPSVQGAILDHVLKSETTEDLGFLAKLLKSKDEAVAFRVAVALGLRGNAKGKKLLLEAITGDNRDKKVMALKAIRTIATRDVFPHLKAIVKNPKSDIELLTAAYAVYAEQRYDKLAKHLDKRIAESTELEQRAAAVRIIGRVKGSAALDTLHRLLGDGAAIVRAEAAKAIGDIGHRMSLDVVASALDRESQTDSKIALIETLGAIRDPKVANRLQMYVYDPSPDVRRAVVNALVAIRHADAAPILDQFLQNERDASIRRTALFGLLQLGPKRYFTAFQRAIGWIGADEVDSLVSTHKAAMLAHLQIALSSDRAELRKVAFGALVHLSKGQRTKLYGELALKSTFRDLRVSAINALVELQGKKASDVLTGLVDDRELEVRVAALEQLGALKDKRITPKLYQLLNASEERVRVASAAALLRL
ncbi:MAG: HEAT repeat domain-containing protein [Myxococcota bacterium]